MYTNRKKLFGIVLAVIIIIVSLILPENGKLTPLGMKTVGLLLAYLVILVTEALPVVIVSLLACGLLPLLGIVPGLKAALSGYSEPIVFFVFASSGLAMAMTTTPLSKRILRTLLKKFGKNIESVLLSMMLCCSIIHLFISNVPACAIFMALSLDFLKLYEDENSRKITGRAFMIAVPVACMISGMIVPTSSSVNLMAIALTEQHTGQTISFLEWVFAGFPLALVMMPIAWFLIIKIHKPVQITRSEILRFTESLDIPERMESREKKVIVIACIMLVLWILSSWIREINVIAVAILGCCVLCLPGMHILDVKTFLRETNWDTFFLVGAILSISGAMIDNGVSSVLAESIPVLDVSLFLLIGFSALFIFVSLLIIPVAPSLLPIVAMPLISLATGGGVSPVLIMLTAGLCAGNCYLLPLDAVPLITYSKGYYSMTDMAKTTFGLQILLIILTMIWIPVVEMIFH